jgi:putative nucleotidyltransferase with HDIG domain
MQGLALIVDDDAAFRTTLAAMLEEMGFATAQAVNLRTGLAAVRENDPDLVLVDLYMPGGSGMKLVRTMHKEQPCTPVIIVSGKGKMDDVIAALHDGAWNYIKKPLPPRPMLKVSLERAMERSRLLRQNMKSAELLEQEVVERTRDLQRSLAQVQQMFDQIIRTMVKIVEMRDPYTFGHQERVADLSVHIARKMQLDPETCDAIFFAGLLHDLGKIHVPTEILVRPGELSAAEFEVLMQHAEVGAQVLQEIEFPWPIAEIVQQHHERLDGSGYPQGLRAPQIRLEAQILAVADVVESMSSHRPYRPGRSLEFVIDELRRHRGTRYNPDAVDACVELFTRENYRLPEPPILH